MVSTVDLQSLKVDKLSNGVCFNEKEHLYWNQNNKKKYTSVTQLISKYKNKFDTDLTAILNVCKSKDIFVPKASRTSYYDVEVFLRSLGDKVELQLILKESNALKYKWAVNNARDCRNGTLVHALIEENIKNHPLRKIVNSWEEFIENEHCLYPEALVFDNDNMICGQVDLIERSGNKIIITDHKTASNFDNIENSYNDFLKPLDYLRESKLSVYNTQLSLYAYILHKMLKNSGIDTDIEKYQLMLNLISLTDEFKSKVDDYAVLLSSSHKEVCNNLKEEILVYISNNAEKCQLGEPYLKEVNLILGDING